MINSSAIFLLFVPLAALLLGVLIYVVNVVAARRADWVVKMANEVVFRERAENRVHARKRQIGHA